MTTVSGRNFGYLIAFVLPGTLMLLAIAVGSPEAKAWLIALAKPPEGGGSTVGGFLYVTLASVFAGHVSSSVRWIFLDSIHHVTGVKQPVWDDSQLQANLGAFDAIIENHYRFYQMYSNSIVGLVAILVARRCGGMNLIEWTVLDTAIVAVCILFWAGSRDTLKRYYSRASVLLGAQQESEVYHDKRTQDARPGTGHQDAKSGIQGQSSGSSEPVEQAPAVDGEGISLRVEGWPGLVVHGRKVSVVLEFQAADEDSCERVDLD